MYKESNCVHCDNGFSPYDPGVSVGESCNDLGLPGEYFQNTGQSLDSIFNQCPNNRIGGF